MLYILVRENECTFLLLVNFYIILFFTLYLGFCVLYYLYPTYSTYGVIQCITLRCHAYFSPPLPGCQIYHCIFVYYIEQTEMNS